MSYLASRYPGGRRVLARDVIDRYGLERTTMAQRLVTRYPVLSLWLVLGDLDLEMLDLDAHSGDARIGLTSRAAPRIHGLLVTGSLSVRGPVLSAGRPGALSLFVMGELRAGNVALSGVEVLVGAQTTVTDVLWCSGAGGQAWFDGGVRARLVVSDDFAVWVSGPLHAPVLDTGTARISVRDGEGVQQVRGDVPLTLVISEELLEPAPPAGSAPGSAPRPGPQAWFQQVHAALASHRPLLTPAFRAGEVDLEAIRERAWLLRQGSSLMRGKRFSSAAGMFRSALARGAPSGPTSVQLVDALYRAHQLTGDRAGLWEALRLLDEYVARPHDGGQDEQLARVLMLRASVVLQLDENDVAFDRSWADHSRALSLDPSRVQLSAEDLAETFSLMGRWLYSRRQYEQSVQVLRWALAERADHEQANGTLARALWMLGREVEAIPYASRSLRVNPGDDFLWFVRGKCRQRLGDHGQARTDLRTYLDLHPDDEFTVEALVEAAFDSHRPDLALDEARRFAAGRPEHADANARLGRLVNARGHPAEAVPLLRRALQQQGASQQTVERATKALARALLALGGDVDGLERAMRTVELATEHDHELYLRGECYRVLGDLDQAEAELSAYLKERPDSPGAIASLAMVHLAAGRAEDAYRLIGMARHLAPDDGYVERCAAVLAA